MPESAITKRALAQALKDLMRQHPFQKISVGQICAACGMNRKSFYYHFRDKQDLVCWIFQSEFLASIRLTEDANGWSILSDACNFLYAEHGFYRAVLAIDGQNSLREYLTQQVRPLLVEVARELFEGVNAQELDFCLSFYSDAFLASIIRWLSEPEPSPPEEYIAQLRQLLEITARIIDLIFPEKPPSI